MVILGNPPYSGESANKGAWIMKLLEDYKKEPGGVLKLKERNPKWLNNDYVKFLRFGQYFIEKNGAGILAYINPHGFLDNPTFRGMRWNLLKTYDKIYTIDLHGDAKKKETSLDGSPDVNVFDIKLGVSINILIKTGKKTPGDLARIYNFNLLGKREAKYNYLMENSLERIPFKEILPTAPNYFFVNKNFETQSQYEQGFNLNSLFKLNSVGIVTARDGFTISQSKNTLIAKISDFISMDNEQARIKFNLGKDARDWKIEYAKNDLKRTGPDFSKIIPITYRPFDNKFTYYTEKSKGFLCMPRGEVMFHFVKQNNLGLVVGRQGQVVGSMQWNLSFVTEFVTDFNLYYRGGGVVFPLYLYPNNSTQLTIDNQIERKPNFQESIIEKFEKILDLRFVNEEDLNDTHFSPIDVLDYIYAITYNPTYRNIYKEFLKIDFPKIPYPKNVTSFRMLAGLGGQLRETHLLKSKPIDNYITSYPRDGNNVVSKWVYQNGKVKINETQYFDNVPEIAWHFYIGGYQPAQKWLKDRKGRELSFDDILHYQRMIVALSETDRLMKEIDKIDFE